jgi:glycosyltransferase involved in cell wall biosynthesis
VSFDVATIASSCICNYQSYPLINSWTKNVKAMAAHSERPYTVICCSDNMDPQWRWIERSFDPQQIIFKFVGCVPRNWFERSKWLNLSRLRGCYEVVRLARRTDAKAVVTHGPALAGWCCIFASLLGVRIPILAHSFNFTTLPGALKRWFFSKALRRVDHFVVYSTMEKALYAHMFNLPPDRFDLVLWSVNPPTVERPNSAIQPGDYVSAIGGNARDYRTLLDAARRLPQIQFVLVVRPESLEGFDIPPNVIIHQNLPIGLTMNLLFFSRFMVLPLGDLNVPSGHVTLVAAMHLGKAFVITDTLGVRDYIRDGENALSATLGSGADLAAKIKLLWDDPSLCDRLGANGQGFAAQYCSEERITNHFRDWLMTKGLTVEPRKLGNALSSFPAS